MNRTTQHYVARLNKNNNNDNNNRTMHLKKSSKVDKKIEETFVEKKNDGNKNRQTKRSSMDFTASTKHMFERNKAKEENTHAQTHSTHTKTTISVESITGGKIDARSGGK